MEFNDRPELVVDFTTHLEEIQNRLTFTQSKGRTALLDAVYLALQHHEESQESAQGAADHLRWRRQQQPLHESEIKNLVREADVQIYAIGIFESDGVRGRTPEEAVGPGLLTRYRGADRRTPFPVENLNELPDMAAKIGVELRNQYVLGYTPNNQERDGKYRQVQVKLVQPRGLPPLRAFWRLAIMRQRSNDSVIDTSLTSTFIRGAGRTRSTPFRGPEAGGRRGLRSGYPAGGAPHHRGGQDRPSGHRRCRRAPSGVREWRRRR